MCKVDYLSKIDSLEGQIPEHFYAIFRGDRNIVELYNTIEDAKKSDSGRLKYPIVEYTATRNVI